MFETLVTRSFLSVSLIAVVIAWAHGVAAVATAAPVTVVQLPTVLITGKRTQTYQIVAVVPSKVEQITMLQ